MAVKKNNTIAVLDIGTTKTVCIIAQIMSGSAFKITGLGHNFSQGIKSGVIIDTKAIENSILSSVSAAETMADTNIDMVSINVSGNLVRSHIIEGDITLSNSDITSKDISRAINKALENYKDIQHDIIHYAPIEYAMGETTGIKNPEGMVGDNLSVKLGIITASQNSIINLTNCLARCHLNIRDYIASPYASSLSCLSEDDKDSGVLLLEIGGGNSSISLFKNGNLIYTETISLGGLHITNDIACGLSISMQEAERIKILHGSTICTQVDKENIIKLSDDTDDDDANQISNALLIKIIRARVEEILEILKERFQKSGFNKIPYKRIVITGGTSQLQGLKELVTHIFNKQVKIGYPKIIHGLPNDNKSPAFSCSLGMLMQINEELSFENNKIKLSNKSNKNFVKKIFIWCKEYL